MRTRAPCFLGFQSNHPVTPQSQEGTAAPGSALCGLVRPELAVAVLAEVAADPADLGADGSFVTGSAEIGGVSCDFGEDGYSELWPDQSAEG